MLEFALFLFFPAAMALAGSMDFFTMTIPNKISLALVAAFVVAAVAVQAPIDQVMIHVGVGVAALVVGFGLFALNLLGGGDAKLMAAGAMWMGYDLALPYVAYITIFGGVLSLIILGYRRFVPVHAMSLPGWAVRLHTNGGGIPYGIAIAAAGLALYPQTTWFHALSM